MGKIVVKLTDHNNVFYKENGEKFEPHVTHEVEHTDHIQKAIECNVLTRVRSEEAPIVSQAPAASTRKPKEDEKKD